MDRQEWFERYLNNLGFDESRYLPDQRSATLEEWQSIRTALIKFAISMLPRPEKHVARMIFLEGLTEAEAAAKLKLSRIKVHRLKWKVKAILFSSPLLRFLLPPNRPVRDPDR